MIGWSIIDFRVLMVHRWFRHKTLKHINGALITLPFFDDAILNIYLPNVWVYECLNITYWNVWFSVLLSFPLIYSALEMSGQEYLLSIWSNTITNLIVSIVIFVNLYIKMIGCLNLQFSCIYGAPDGTHFWGGSIWQHFFFLDRIA